MHGFGSKSRTFLARGFAALWALLALGAVSGAPPAEAAPFAYVTTDGGVSVIDTATNTLVTTIPVKGGADRIAVAPDGKHVYVSSFQFAGIVSVIDAANNMVVATVPAGIFPSGLAVSRNGKQVYVTHNYEHGGCIGEGFVCEQDVSVIDTATNTNSSAFGLSGFSLSVAVTPDGKNAYVTMPFNNEVSVIGSTSSQIPVGDIPLFVSVTPDGKHAYVSNVGSGDISVIDTNTNMVAATIPVGGTGVAIAPDGKYAYVATVNAVAVVNTASNTVDASVPLAGSDTGFVAGIALTPDGKFAYALLDSSVAVIDTTTNAVVTVIPVTGGGEIAIMAQHRPSQKTKPQRLPAALPVHPGARQQRD